MSLTLTRAAMAATEPTPGQHAWPLEVEAVSTTDGLESEIFVYHAAMEDDPIVGDLFECVASLNQMSELGTDPIDLLDPTVPYYRSDSLTFACRSVQEADELWVKIQADALDLLNNVKAFATLTPLETVVFE